MENGKLSMENENIPDISGAAVSPGKAEEKKGATLSFEDAYKQMADIVKKMESGALPLSDAVKAYEQAAKLKSYCEQMLKQAEVKIEQLNPADAS